ncbi:MAG: aminoglycoside phosphotransferase family protein [Chloroflexi bacterium]|nr:aminoglycoside phosphotransferase family protein [Chloroflexota bacterium]MCC6897044.1 aminoglycoside phosphotransferase family protein [Anaerolineae bacterium]
MSEWTCYVSLIIPQWDTAQITLVPDGDRWRLPRVIATRLYTHLYLLARTIKTELGADVILLREVVQKTDAEAKIVESVWLVDNQTLAWTMPEGGRWFGRDELDGVSLVEEWMHPALVETLETLLDDPPPKRPDWYKRGWFTGAAAWMRDTLLAQGYTLSGEPEPFKHGPISSLLWVDTTGGEIYFKVAIVLPLFGNEPLLSAALGRLFPQYIPAPLAIDAERRWMLTANLGTVISGTNPPVELLKTVMQVYARLQIQSADYLDVLFEAGCLDRRLPVLEGQIDGLLADEATYAELNAAERAAWQASGNTLKGLCRKLADYGIPDTLVHGDFHAGNIAYDGERISYFDWTDACIAHPFFDVVVFITFDAGEHGDALRDAYLAEWTAYAPMERLREIYGLAKILGALHQAVSYQGIVNGMDPSQRASWDDMIPRFARDILKQIDQLP